MTLLVIGSSTTNPAMPRNPRTGRKSRKLGDDDFTIYDGQPSEGWVTTREDACSASQGGGFFDEGGDENYLSAIINDALETSAREAARRRQMLAAQKHSDDLDCDMSDEEYEEFLNSQAREKYRYMFFQQVLDEILHYVPDMLSARSVYYEHLGIPMSQNLMNLDKKPLFYY